MDGLSRVLGEGPQLNVCGKDWSVKSVLRHYAAIEAEILRLRGNPFDAIPQAVASFATQQADGLSKEQAELVSGRCQAMLSVTMRQIVNELRTWKHVSNTDYVDFVSTPRGRAFLVSKSIEHNPGAPSPEDVLAFVVQRFFCKDVAWIEESERVVAQAAGMDTLGNSTGQS